MKVKRMIKSDVDTFKVGDIIKVKLTDGVKVQAMAMQQEEDGMIFCLVDCLPGEYPMNSTRTNEGGYEESDLRKKLNGEILNLFPAELKAIVYKPLHLCGAVHRYIVKLQACRGHIIALTIAGQGFAPWQA